MKTSTAIPRVRLEVRHVISQQDVGVAFLGLAVAWLAETQLVWYCLKETFR